MTTNSKARNEPLSKERLRVWLKLLKTHAAIEHEIRTKLRTKFNTTLPRFDVMSALQRNPKGIRMSEISVLLKVSNGNVTGIVERLTQDGLVTRIIEPADKRVQKVKLTVKGKNAFKKMAAAHEQWLDELLTELNAAQMGSLNNLLDTITDHLATDR